MTEADKIEEMQHESCLACSIVLTLSSIAFVENIEVAFLT